MLSAFAPTSLADALDHARDLRIAASTVIDAAEAAIRSAQDELAVAAHIVADCTRSRELWADVRSGQSHLLSCCLYCDQVRAHDGTWFSAGAELRRALRQGKRISLSHGICPSCAITYFADEESGGEE